MKSYIMKPQKLSKVCTIRLVGYHLLKMNVHENINSDFYGKKTPATYFQKLIIYYLIYLYFDLDSE